MQLPKGFEEIPSRLAGNTQSAHGVVFGKLYDQDVAIKPFEEAGQGVRECVRKARHEEAMYERVRDLGYLTFLSLDVIEMPEGALLVTAYEPDLMSGSTLSLGEVGQSTTRREAVGATEGVMKIARVLGHLHNDGVTHGDAKPRNFSFHRKSGIGPLVVDLEVARDHGKDGTGHEYFWHAVRADMRSLTYSLGFQGFGGESMKGAWQLLEEIVLGPYHEVAERPLPASTLQAAKNGLMEGRGVFFSESMRSS
jgi:hypothetical protein